MLFKSEQFDLCFTKNVTHVSMLIIYNELSQF
jgi:hypothetical protein